MTYEQAIQTATACLAREIKRLAVDANMHDAGLVTPHTRAAAAQRAKLRAALVVLGQQTLFKEHL